MKDHEEWGIGWNRNRPLFLAPVKLFWYEFLAIVLTVVRAKQERWTSRCESGRLYMKVVVQQVTPPSDAPLIDRVSTDGLPSWIAEDNSRVVCLHTPQYATSSSLPSLTAECATRLHRSLLRSPGFLSSSGLGRSIQKACLSTAALPEYEFPFVASAECSTMDRHVQITVNRNSSVIFSILGGPWGLSLIIIDYHWLLLVRTISKSVISTYCSTYCSTYHVL